MVKAEIVVL